MPKPIIVGIDVDSTLANLTDPLSQLIHEERGIMVPRYAVDKWDYYVEILGSAVTMLEMMDRAWNDGMVVPEESRLSQTLRLLKIPKFHKMVITSRTPRSHAAVVQWLQDNGLDYNSTVLVDRSLSKFDFPLDILIDDQPACAEEVARYPSKFLYLRDQPWNQDVALPDNSMRVGSVREAVNHILRTAE
jgi:hypothetical protein